MVLTVNNLSMTFDYKVLFKEATFRVFENEKVGIVGANGAGKSTLVKILGHQIIPDSGDVIFEKGLKIGYLDQYLKLDKHIQIIDYLKLAFAKEIQKEEELNEINHRISENPENINSLIKRATAIRETLEQSGFYALESSIMRVASGLGIHNYGMNTPLGKLSGGQKVKVILAKLLLEKPDLLIMDEPTNFLDTSHVDWLVKYLKEYKGAVMIVSHHQEFLNDVATVILDLDFGKITRYRGNYDSFTVKKAQFLENYEKAYDQNEKERKKLEEFVNKNRAGASSARQAQDRVKKLEKLEVMEKPKLNQNNIHLSFNYQPISSQRFLRVNDLEIGYYGSLLPPINFELKSGDKLGLTGFNGIGKSTLLKTLIGEIPPIKGTFRFVDDALIAYFAQEHHFPNETLTPIQAVREIYPLMDDRSIRSLLARVALTGNLPNQNLKSLSGGEQAKFKLALMMLQKANVLILDEPTNHLDTLAKEGLMTALKNYPGTVIFVTHEREFLTDLATKIFDFENLLIS